jgi:hypothetical protein
VVKVFQDPDLRGKFMAGYYLPALDYANLGKPSAPCLTTSRLAPTSKAA